MKRLTTLFIAALSVAVWIAPTTHAGERGLTDYAAQKAAGKDVKKIVFIGDFKTHGARGNHEFLAASILISRALHAAYPNVHAVVHSSKAWPKDLKHADAIVVLLNNGGRAARDPNIAAAVKRGAGFSAIHYGVEVKKGKEGDNFLKWMGGYFEVHWSCNPHWTAEFTSFPKHPVARGLKPFTMNDEWYYHMRFVSGPGVTPILSALPPLKTCMGNGPRNGNEAVRAEVKAGKKQHLAWVYKRPDGGRGFGFTGLHRHRAFTDDSFRTSLINGVAWIAGLEIPKNGVPSKKPTKEDLQETMKAADAIVKGGN